MKNHHSESPNVFSDIRLYGRNRQVGHAYDCLHDLFLLSKAFPLVVLVAVACSQPPTKELEMTSSRLEEAREAEAMIFAKALMEEANMALANAHVAKAAGKYDRAIDSAARASKRANEALVEAKRHRFPFLKRTERLLLETETFIAMLRNRALGTVEVKELLTLEQELKTLHERLHKDAITVVSEKAASIKVRLLAFEQELESTRNH